MKMLFRTYLLGIVAVLVVAYIIGCGDVDTEQEPESPEVIATDQDKASGTTDGKPVTVTDATFDTVVLEAESPVVLELGAEW